MSDDLNARAKALDNTLWVLLTKYGPFWPASKTVPAIEAALSAKREMVGQRLSISRCNSCQCIHIEIITCDGHEVDSAMPASDLARIFMQDTEFAFEAQAILDSRVKPSNEHKIV